MAYVALSAAWGCYRPTAKDGAPCSSVGECPSGQRCDRAVEPPICTIADARPIDAPPDAPPTCADATDCDAALPVCDLGLLQCRGCIGDAECGTDVCLEYDGTCHNASNSLFITPAGTGNTCSRATPCTFPVALGQLANNQRVIVVGDGIYTSQLNIPAGFTANSLTLSGIDRDPAGAVVTPSNLAPALFVESSPKDVIVEGITFDGPARGVDSRGLLTLSRVAVTMNAQGGIIGSGTGTLQILDSTISANAGRGIDVNGSTVVVRRTVISGNSDGGIELKNSGFTIESCFITNNGVVGNGFGGVRLQDPSLSPRTFEFNTVVDNLAQSEAGVQCSTALTLDSSILVDAIGASCAATYSLFPLGAPAGIGNIAGDPSFIAPTAFNYHIGPSSIAREVANPAAVNIGDIDGEPRPLGGGRDIGADEVP